MARAHVASPVSKDFFWKRAVGRGRLQMAVYVIISQRYGSHFDNVIGIKCNILRTFGAHYIFCIDVICHIVKCSIVHLAQLCEIPISYKFNADVLIGHVWSHCVMVPIWLRNCAGWIHFSRYFLNHKRVQIFDQRPHGCLV